MKKIFDSLLDASEIVESVRILWDAPEFALSLAIHGLLIGAVFALAAYGLALVWGVMNVKNLAQGDLVIIGGYITWYMAQLGIHPLFGVPVAFLFLWFLGGGLYLFSISQSCQRYCATRPGTIAIVVILKVGVYLNIRPDTVPFGNYISVACFAVLTLVLILSGGFYGVIIRHVITRDLFTSLLATFGIALVIAQALNLMFGSDTQTAESGFETLYFWNDAIAIPMAKLIALILAAILAGCIIVFMKRSRMGQAIRATAQDARAARVMGIDTEKVYAFTFSLNAAICGAAGALIVMIWVIQPYFGITHSIRSFVIVTAAGFGNLPGVIAMGFGMGVFEQFGGFVLGAEYQQALVVGLLIVVLIIRQLLQSRQRQVVSG